MKLDSSGGGETMQRQGRWMHVVAVLAAIGALAACGDDSPVGPGFGDLAFTPSNTLLLESAREGSATLSNVGTIELGPIVLGANLAVGRPPLEAGGCPSFQTLVVPNSITSLTPGATANLDISIDDSNVDVRNCPTGDYDIRIQASVNDLTLGALTVIITWDGQN